MSSSSSVFHLFSNTSVLLLQKHMAQVNACAQALMPFFEAVIALDWKVVASQQALIGQLEHECDDIKRQIRINLPKGLFSPVPRPDILLLVATQDDIANVAEDIAGVIYGRSMPVPESIKSSVLDFLGSSLSATAQANKAISELDELLITGFSGSAVGLLKSIINQLNRIESETDDLQIVVRSLLYKLEKTIPPIDMMFLYKVVEWIGELADHAQKVGGQLLLLLAR